MRAAVDVMGGDKAPEAVLRGCFDAAELLDGDDRILLVGDESIIRPALDTSGVDVSRYEVVPTTQVVDMCEPPVEAIRNKPDSSLAVVAKLAAKGDACVAISAGNTGAGVAAAQLRMRTLPGVQRPGIAVIMPTVYGPVVYCDVGANPEPRPMHLLQYAVMASAYFEATTGKTDARVGLLNIGSEDGKGTAMVKETRKLLRDAKGVNFIGNVEGRGLFRGECDVVITDGFVGNIVLKFAEGLFEGLFATVKKELAVESEDLVERFKPVMGRIAHDLDWQEYGGAPLLGVGGYFLIGHGASDARAIRNTIRAGKKAVASNVNETIIQRIAAAKSDVASDAEADEAVSTA
ncbi:MAG: phosphate acyltransferase PlsX [Planctomycetota bacterium]